MKQKTRQHTGGVANFHGNEFERFFAMHRVLRAIHELGTGQESRLAFQLKGAHVDDWVEDRQNSRDHFQLKTTKKLAWSSMRSDFEQQLASKIRGKRVSALLVVGTVRQQLKLAKRAPAGVEVISFAKQNVTAHLRRGPIREALERACVASPATQSDLEWIWKDANLAWDKARKVGKFVRTSAVLTHLEDRRLPLRTPWRPSKRWKRAQRLLSGVAGLKVRIDGGHLLYDDGTGTSGRISCRTPSFEHLVAAVLRSGSITLATFSKILEAL